MAETKAAEAKEEAEIAVRMPADIVRMARVIIAHKGGTMADAIGPHARPGVTRAYRKVVDELSEKDPEPPFANEIGGES